MKKTKNNYVIELNEIYPHYEPFMEYLTIKSNKVRNMLDKGMYGNVLRKHDPIGFQVGYNKYSNYKN